MLRHSVLIATILALSAMNSHTQVNGMTMLRRSNGSDKTCPKIDCIASVPTCKKGCTKCQVIPQTRCVCSYAKCLSGDETDDDDSLDSLPPFTDETDNDSLSQPIGEPSNEPTPKKGSGCINCLWAPTCETKICPPGHICIAKKETCHSCATANCHPIIT